MNTGTVGLYSRGSRLSWGRCARAATRFTCNAVVLLSAAVLLALAIGPHVFGYRTVVMRTGSMEPSISPGDVLVIRPERVSSLRRGQILTFAAPVAGKPVFSHRVTAVRRTATDTVVTTKGDANATADPWRARIDDKQAWHVVGAVPGVGWLIAGLRRPLVHLVSVWLIPAALCADVLRHLWRRPGARDEWPPKARNALS